MQEREVDQWRRIVNEEELTSRAKRNKQENEEKEKEESGSSGREENNGEGGRGGRGGGRGDVATTPHWVENAGGFLSLPEVEVLDGQEFMEAFVNRSRPAVIKVTLFLVIIVLSYV